MKQNYLGILLLCAFISIQSQDYAASPTVSEHNDVWITIFVHGIVGATPSLSIATITRLMADQIDDTLYANTVKLMRKDPYFYQNQAMQGLGLKKVDLENKSPENSAGTLARLYEEVSTMCGIHTINYFYTFGWSGLISASYRNHDAKNFYRDLLELISSYHKKNIYPKLRIIGYSHGGSICLTLAKIQKENPQTNITINELILLATPIHQDIDSFVLSPIFKKVYNIYSASDHIQKLDIFSSRQFFSQRTFQARKGFKLPKKLVQIRLKITRKMRRKKQRSRQKNDPTSNFNKSSIVSGKSNLLRNASPGHIEMWSFGWTRHYYRKTFPLSPLSTVAILPYILTNVQKIEPKLPDNRVIADIRPDNGVMLLKYRTVIKRFTIAPFLSVQILNELKQQTKQYIPKSYSIAEYKKRLRKISKQARLLHKKQLQEKRANLRLKLRMKRRNKRCSAPKKSSTYADLVKRFHNLIKSSILICCARNNNTSSGILSISK